MGTNKFASQQGMTAYGTRRHLYDPKLGTDQPLDQATISLQMGTNKGASQVGTGGALSPGASRAPAGGGDGDGQAGTRTLASLQGPHCVGPARYGDTGTLMSPGDPSVLGQPGKRT